MEYKTVIRITNKKEISAKEKHYWKVTTATKKTGGVVVRTAEGSVLVRGIRAVFVGIAQVVGVDAAPILTLESTNRAGAWRARLWFI